MASFSFGAGNAAKAFGMRSLEVRYHASLALARRGPGAGLMGRRPRGAATQRL